MGGLSGEGRFETCPYYGGWDGFRPSREKRERDSEWQEQGFHGGVIRREQVSNLPLRGKGWIPAFAGKTGGGDDM